MPETKPLFWLDPYKIEFTAIIIKIDGKIIILDQTCFYPMGGGQPADKGLLFKKKNGETISFEVLDVQKENGQIIHILNKQINSELTEGEEICGKIDWGYRYSLMRAHTAQHIISAYIFNNFDIATTDINLTPEEISIHLDGPVSENILKKTLCNVLNICTSTSRRIKSHIVSRSQAEENYSSKIRGPISDEENIRILEIEGWDIMCCGGTHVHNTNEIGPIALTQIKKGMDLRFSLGQKSIQDISDLNVDFLLIGTLLNTEPDKILDLMKKRVKELKKSTSTLNLVLLDYLEKVSKTSGNRISETTFYIIPFEMDKKIINKGFKLFNENTVLISLSQDHKIVILSSSDDFGAKKVLKKINEKYGGRGGGSPKMAQGIIGKEILNPENTILSLF